MLEKKKKNVLSKYLNFQTQISKEILYIGDTTKSRKCAYIKTNTAALYYLTLSLHCTC